MSCIFTDFSYWHTGRKFDVPVYTTQEIYVKALRLLNLSSYKKQVRNLAVSVYDLIPARSEQLEMFAQRSHVVAAAMDKITDKYGEFVITPALMILIHGWIAYEPRGKRNADKAEINQART